MCPMTSWPRLCHWISSSKLSSIGHKGNFFTLYQAHSPIIQPLWCHSTFGSSSHKEWTSTKFKADRGPKNCVTNVGMGVICIHYTNVCARACAIIVCPSPIHSHVITSILDDTNNTCSSFSAMWTTKACATQNWWAWYGHLGSQVKKLKKNSNFHEHILSPTCWSL
jgi:hypothetical protein